MIAEFEKCKTLEEVMAFYEVLLRTLTSSVSDVCMQRQFPLPEAMSKIYITIDKVTQSVKKHVEDVLAMYKNKEDVKEG